MDCFKENGSTNLNSVTNGVC